MPTRVREDNRPKHMFWSDRLIGKKFVFTRTSDTRTSAKVENDDSQNLIWNRL